MTMLTIRRAMEMAAKGRQSGRLAEAEKTYRQILTYSPDCAEAMHGLGLLAQQAGNHAAALEWFDRSVAANPSAAQFHLSRGIVLTALGRLEPAVAAPEHAAALRPDLAQAHHHPGNARSECPWYPRVRLFRQARDGDWSRPMRELAQALHERFTGTAIGRTASPGGQAG